MVVVLGVSDVQWCVHRLLSGRVGVPEWWSERFIQRCDVGELQQPGFNG